MNASPRYCAHCGAANTDDATTCFVCDQPLSETERLAPDLLAKPPLKGRYHLLAQLGVGGFGAVYRAEDAGLGNRIVAVKEMAQGGLKPAELAEATEAFQREAYLLAGLKHPNLPHIYDHFREAGRWYLVMDFIEGQTLETILVRALEKRLPVNDVLKIGLQLANVLNYLHTNQPPIIFRDLKPANVMLTANDHAYLIDFGIARLFKPGQAKDTLIIGTPGYLAPEGYGKAQTTPRSDIYSLGATIHHLLSGLDPSERPFFFAPLQPPVPAPLQAMVAQMVQMDERDRPASMADVKARLQQIADTSAFAAPTTAMTSSSPAEYGPASPPTDKAPANPPRIVPVAGKLYLPTLPPIQNKAAVTRRTVAIGLGAVVAGGAIWALARQMAPQPRVRVASTSTPYIPEPYYSPTPPPTPTPIASQTTVYQIYTNHTGGIVALAWSPLDGITIASASLDDTTQIWDSSTQRLYFTHSGSVSKMAWSPDGQYIATGGVDNHVWVWRATSGANLITFPNEASSSRRDFLLAGQRMLTGQLQRSPQKPAGKRVPGSAGGINTLAWSPDSQRIAGSGNANSIQIWDALSGEQLLAFGNEPFALAWNKDGLSILSGGGGPGTGTDVYLWDTSNGTMLGSYGRFWNAPISLAISPDGRFFASGGYNDYTVRVWDESNDSQITIYSGHGGEINSIAWSPDGKRIASASDDGTVRIWDAATGDNTFVFRGHSAPVRAVAWSPQTNQIASGGDDTTVQIWEPQ